MIILLIIGTIIAVFCVFMIVTASDDITTVMLISCKENEEEKIKRFTIELNRKIEKMKEKGTLKDKKSLKSARTIKKKIDAAQKLKAGYENGKVSVLDYIPIIGYRILQLLKWDAQNGTVKVLYKKCHQFKDKKEAMNYTIFLLSALFGYLTFGLSVFFIIFGITTGMEMGSRSFVIAGVCFIVFALLGYIPYDNMNVVVKKRREEIEQTFPSVISKMALLVISGMEVNKAWQLTSISGEGVLYDEMSRVTLELNNNVPPQEVYTKFMVRCDNPYTTKLATAIIQNISKGNSEIAKLFKTLNYESWQEHKHNSRRMGEQIQGKLLIPTLLMFVGIIILIIVPIVTGLDFF